MSHAMSTFYSGQGHTWVVMLVDFALGAAEHRAGLPVDLRARGVSGHGDRGWRLGHRGVGHRARWSFTRCCCARPAQCGEVRLAAMGVSMATAAAGCCGSAARPASRCCLEVAGFTAFVLLVGRLGEQELAATNLAFNVSSLAFMPVFGLSTGGVDPGGTAIGT